MITVTSHIWLNEREAKIMKDDSCEINKNQLDNEAMHFLRIIDLFSVS